MSLPKEPRQKMINMMYLVLTALLALNVSSEILNAFKTVNNSIIHANEVVDDKNATTFKSFEAKLKRPETAEKAALWLPKAKAAQKLSDEMAKYIEDLKNQLKIESKGENLGTPEEHFSEDNLEASTRLLVEGPKGKELEQKLTEYKNQMLAIIPEEKAAFEKSLPLDLSAPKGQKGDLTQKPWADGYFHMTPSIAAVTILSKFQNDVKNSEAQIVDFCHKKIGEVEVHMDQVGVLVGQSSNYVMPGQEISVTAGVGAYSSKATSSISINGSPVTVTNGQGTYKTVANGTGEHSVAVNVTFTDENGKPVTKTEIVKYTVGIPSGSSIFLEKMNVMYVGVENPLTISAGSAGREKMKPSFTLGSLTSAGGDRYIAKPSAVGPAEIRVTVDGKTSSFPIRCKALPDPTAMVGGKKGGSMPSADFKAQGGVIAKLLESDFDAPYQVLSYRVGANGGAFSSYKEAANDGPRWSGAAASLINQAGPGASIFFDQIRVRGVDGKERQLPTLAFQLK